MSQSRPRSLPVDDWRELRDAVRGVRRFRFDEGLLPREAWLAGGEHLELAHDDEGHLRAVDVDGLPFLRIDRDGTTTRFAKHGVVTDFRIDGEGRERTLVTRGETLRFQYDREGRIVRAFLPGSPTPLEYEWSGPSCAIGPLGGAPLLTIEPEGSAMRVTLVETGGGWDETPPLLGAQTITIRGRGDRELATCRGGDDTMHRPIFRHWSDGDSETWRRDEKGRLTEWTRNAESRTYRYDEAGDLVDEREGAAMTTRETDDGHRVNALFRRDGSKVEYRFDGAGRRVARVANEETTTYVYDAMGQLTRVTTPRRDVRYTYDGLGRRIAVTDDRGTRYEHRDSGGRLWAVTDSRGRALHVFVWFDGRMIARIDGDSDASLSEAFITDGAGTLIAVLAPRGNELALERVDASPFGAVSSPMRPTLYGHIGDPETKLIHFGARDLDPELGLFLTPDPWDGAPDDPRLWEGGDPATLARHGEMPSATVHPYALCHFDPVGRSDLDGHYVDGWGIVRTIFLAPTWGAPLTSISLFFFLPFNIYFELIGDFIFLIAKICTGAIKAPWSNHHLWKLIGGAGSSRQGLIAFGLNGLLPRWISSGLDIHADRAVTVGHVIWINREELNVMDEPRVMEVWDIGGPPRADGSPSGGATAFNESATKDSVIAVTGTKAAKSRVHVSPWTRGFANTVVDNAGVLKFEDRPSTAVAGVAPGTMVMLTPLSGDFPHARESDDNSVSMEVQEYLFDHTTGRESEGVLETAPIAFAIRIPTSNHAAVNDVLEIGAPNVTPVPPTVFVKVIELSHDRILGLFWDSKVDTLFLEQALPANFLTGKGGNDLKVQRVIPDTPATVSTGWAQSGGPRVLEHAAAVADWPPAIIKDQLFRINGAAAADVAFARVSRIEVTLELTPTVTGEAPDNGTAVTLLRTDGAAFAAEVPDHTQFDKLRMTGNHPSLSTGDLLRVTHGAEEKFVRVSGKDGDVLSILPNVSSFTLVANAATPVQVQKYVDTNTSRDNGTGGVVAGDRVTVDCTRAAIFSAGSFAAYVTGGARMFRKVNAVPTIKLHLTHDVAGAGPYSLTPMKIDDTLDENGMKAAAQARFLRNTGAVAPSAFGTYPDSVLAVYPILATPDPIDSAYYISPAVAGNLDPEYGKKWSARTVGGNDFWFFFEDLPIIEKEGKRFWKLDHNWEIELAAPGLPLNFRVREYVRNVSARRADGGGRRVLAKPPEVQVPNFPRVHDTHRRALIEHELHHAVQNSKWGPLMNALPLQGILGAIDIFNTAAGNEQEPWMKELVKEGTKLENQGLGWSQIISMGGLMQFVWKYFFLAPAFFSEDAREAIFATKFDFWQKIFNPFAGLISEAIPVDPDKPAGERWGFALLRLFISAFDLRSWTPFTGFIPTLLPDGPRSFMEQQASRASGDLYSTILTADDEFNFHTHTFFVPDHHGADRQKKLGEATRFLMFDGDRDGAMLGAARGNRTGSPIEHRIGSAPTLKNPLYDGPLFRVEFTGANFALLPQDLFERAAGAPALPLPVDVEGPAPARAVRKFLRVNSTSDLQPRLRSFVPTPPRVTRSTGFYFIPAAPGTYDVTAYYYPDILKRNGVVDPKFVGDKQFANTEHATITVGGVVKLGDRVVDWNEPAIVGAPIAPLPLFELYRSEAQELHIEGLDNRGWLADITPSPSPGLSIAVKGTSGWTIQAAAAFPAAAADREVRVRLFRVFEPNDPAFDLTFDEATAPTLRGKRSLLDAAVWIPVRDFRVEIRDITIANGNRTGVQTHEIDVPIPITSDRITVTPPVGAPALPFVQAGAAAAAFPRGQKWRFGPPATPVAAATVYQVNVRFGDATHPANVPFTITWAP